MVYNIFKKARRYGSIVPSRDSTAMTFVLLQILPANRDCQVVVGLTRSGPSIKILVRKFGMLSLVVTTIAASPG
jgi:hypothetical protein